MTLTITVHGDPKPQGSKDFKGFSKRGRAILVESCKDLPNWRAAVVWAAREAMAREKCAPWSNEVFARFTGPLSVTMVFTLPRPKSAPKSRLWPDRKPDIDKLVRSTSDALKDAGVIEDDARIVHLAARKEFPVDQLTPQRTPLFGCLASPGAVIEIRAL